MDIMELGAIGELVGGVAVVGSLIYLALQVRQSNKQAFRQNAIAHNNSRQADRREINAAFLAIGEDPELCRLLRLGLNDFQVLTKDEKNRLNIFLSTLAVSLTSPSFSAQLDLGDRQASEWAVGVFVGFISTPGGAQWWSEAKLFLNPALVQLVDQTASSRDNSPPLTELVSWHAPDAPATQGA